MFTLDEAKPSCLNEKGSNDRPFRIDVFTIATKPLNITQQMRQILLSISPEIVPNVLTTDIVAETLFKTSKAALIGPETNDAARRTATKDAEAVSADSLTAMERHVEGSILTDSAEIRAQTFDPAAHARNLLGIVRHEAETAFDGRLPTYTWVNGMERRVRKRWELAMFLNGKSKASAGLLE